MSRVIGTDKCIYCEEGTINFTEWDYINEKIVNGSCDSCGVDVGNIQGYQLQKDKNKR